MKDLTPIAPDDFALLEREALKERNVLGFKPVENEGIDLVTEEREARRRERCERLAPIAEEVLEEARSALAVRFRFLDQALWRMPLVANYDIFGIASDGRALMYDPIYVVDRFKLSPNEVVRDVAHCLFHCIFRHPFMLYSVLRQPWDVACDIAIETMLLDLLGEAFPSNMDRRARQALKLIRAQMEGTVTAERLYRFFSGDGNKVDLTSLAPIFFHDSHGLWYGRENGPSSFGSVSVAARESEDGRRQELPSNEGVEDIDDIMSADDDPFGGGESADERPNAADEGDPAERTVEDDAADDEASALDEELPEEQAADEMSDLADAWEEISERIQVDLETHFAQRGEGAGSLIAQLKAVNREAYDYAQFLERFATLHECMRVNDDEFDYIYYLFGLDRYGNMPLIEPLEYKEDRRVHDFVLAIDTSESCSGDVVQAFMRKTYNILKQAESFHDRVNVHIVQCDARIQEDTKITSLDQLERYLETMELKGFGGTDFRPVFEYVDALVAKGEFTDLRGIVYFTDGEGVFPRRPPRYDAVFVFLDDGYTDPQVPPWALKVILDERQLEQPSCTPRGAHRGSLRTR